MYACSVSQGVTLGSALSPAVTTSFTQRLGLSKTQSELASPRTSDASLTRKNKLWPFSKVCKVVVQLLHDRGYKVTALSSNLEQQAMLQKMLEGDPAMMLIQLDVKEGSVNDIVNESVRSTYQVRQLYLSTECSCSVSTGHPCMKYASCVQCLVD